MFGKFGLVFIFFLFFFSGCGDSIRLDLLPKSKCSFINLPEKVQKAYLTFVGPKKLLSTTGDTLTDYSVWDTLVCLNEKMDQCYYKTKWNGSFIDKFEFQIHNRKYELPFNYNTINPPYFVYDKQFYYLHSRNILRSEDIPFAEYGKIDLTTVW